MKDLTPVYMGRQAEVAGIVEFGSIRLDLARLCVQVGARLWSISKREATTLKFFIDNGGRVISREELTWFLWGDKPVSPRAVETVVTRLRRTLKEREVGRIIRTVHSSGYQFTGQPETYRLKAERGRIVCPQPPMG